MIVVEERIGGDRTAGKGGGFGVGIVGVGVVAGELFVPVTDVGDSVLYRDSQLLHHRSIGRDQSVNSNGGGIGYHW